MVSASSPAATQLMASPMTSTDRPDSTTPKVSASSAFSRPPGIGRLRVRSMTASMSRSYHMLMAPAAPAPMAMHSTAISDSTGCRCPGATARPTAPVNTTSDITRGLSSAM